MVQWTPKYHGQLTITAIDRQGNRFIYDTPNLLMYGAAVSCSHVLLGETDYAATYIAFGSSNTAPVRGDTALGTEVYRKTLPTPGFPQVLGLEIGQVQFGILLDFSEANGFTLQEAGLYASNTTLLLARQIHAAIVKDSNFQLEYRWRIIFT